MFSFDVSTRPINFALHPMMKSLLVCLFGMLGLTVAASGSMAQTSAVNPAKPSFENIGRAATAKEVAAWDIDVRPDFKGLPEGSGSVRKGMEVWEAKCASCHGYFGESNQVFNPIVGGTTKADVKTGTVASLTDSNQPQRTTMMKLSSLSTMWDYINRAMPWNQPKSLSVEEVYATTAYILHLADVVPEDFTLSNKNMAATQALLPNRYGKTTAHGLWPAQQMATAPKANVSASSVAQLNQPDVIGARCFTNCEVSTKVASSIPDYARNAHGNLAEQNRTVGPQRGAATDKPQAVTVALTAASVKPDSAKPEQRLDPKVVNQLLSKNKCTACHAQGSRLVGPSWNEIRTKYAGTYASGGKVEGKDVVAYLAGKIKQGGQGAWGPIPMPAQALSEADSRTLGLWLISK
jgi:S-disulfanyl-L-cysteine oxidoreductase SoxD